MPSPAPKPPKAIIVGGSVAGLTLAHCFASAGIEFTLLEARDTIAPSIGATIVLMPNGCRILDQLSVYEPMRKIMTMQKSQITRRSDGRFVGENKWPTDLEERMVYGAAILEREKFLRSLYEQLDDRSKSKILLNKKLVKVEHRDNGISVQCADGTEFEGDFVVGADGIHSRVRLEMQRIAGNIGPPGFLDRDKHCITSEYNCIFGISSPNHSLIPGTVTITREIEHSSLLFVSSDHRPQWFFISKTPQKHHYPSIPRVTKSQMEAQVKKFENFKLTEEVSLRELVDTELRLSYQALEEASHEVWTYGRIVCLGDAMHKMTPNLGQGGNQAIESCAALTNCLMELFSSAQKPSSQSLETAFLKYQNLRKKRAKTFVDISGLTTRDEALDNLKHTLRFLYLPMLNTEQMTSIQTEMYSSAPKLDHLPIPRRIEGNKIWSEGEGKEMKMNKIMRAQL